MADHNVTVSERLNLFGVAPSNKWQEYNWNAFKWGEGTNTVLARVLTYIAESQALTGDVDSLALAKVIAETITASGSPSSEKLTDAAGYYHVFPNNTTEGEERDPVSWTAGAGASTTWSTHTATSTTWS